MADVTCARCRKIVSESYTYFDEDGQICMDCNESVEVSQAFVKGYRSLAGSALGFALLSACFNPFMIISIVAIGTSISAIRYPARIDEEDRASLKGMHAEGVMSVAGLIIALAIAGLGVLGRLGQFALM